MDESLRKVIDDEQKRERVKPGAEGKDIQSRIEKP